MEIVVQLNDAQGLNEHRRAAGGLALNNAGDIVLEILFDWDNVAVIAKRNEAFLNGFLMGGSVQEIL